MQQLPDRNIVDEALKRICSDQIFKRSHSNERILCFLVEEAYKGTDVKEQTIGIELFKKDYSPEENNSKIRVAVYYLRKKLDQYYTDSGKDEEIRFQINKGQYNLTFGLRSETESLTSKQKNKSIQIPLQALYVIFGIIFLLTAISIVLHIELNPGYCWSQYMTEGSSNICIVSDHFITRDINSGENRYILNPDIKNDEDLIIHNKEKPDQKLLLSHFTLFSKMAPFTIQNLTQWFNENNQEFTIRLESELRYEDYKENNLLFIGQAKNMVLSRSVFLQNSKLFHFSEGTFFYTKGADEKQYSAKEMGERFVDYAMVSYFPHENKKDALFFVSEHDIGVMATVKHFTNQQWLKTFFSKLPNKNTHFNALFEVKGINRSDMVCKLIELEVLEQK